MGEDNLLNILLSASRTRRLSAHRGRLALSFASLSSSVSIAPPPGKGGKEVDDQQTPSIRATHGARPVREFVQNESHGCRSKRMLTGLPRISDMTSACRTLVWSKRNLRARPGGRATDASCTIRCTARTGSTPGCGRGGFGSISDGSRTGRTGVRSHRAPLSGCAARGSDTGAWSRSRRSRSARISSKGERGASWRSLVEGSGVALLWAFLSGAGFGSGRRGGFRFRTGPNGPGATGGPAPVGVGLSSSRPSASVLPCWRWRLAAPSRSFRLLRIAETIAMRAKRMSHVKSISQPFLGRAPRRATADQVVRPRAGCLGPCAALLRCPGRWTAAYPCRTGCSSSGSSP